MYKASVVIPVYKAQGTLRRCVESILYGEEKNLEIILVEDCSPDDSWAVCQKLAEEFSNVRCIRNEQNSGVSHTRNLGMAASCGEYILFVDSDDWVSGAYASNLLSTALAYPDALALCGFCFHEKVEDFQQIYIWDNTGRENIVIPQSDYFGLASKVLLQSPCNKAFARNLIKEFNIRFDETQNMGEDFQFVLDYLEAAQIKECVVVNKPLYHYVRWNTTSLMSKFGFVDSKPVFNRIEKLARIVGPGAEKYKDVMIAQSKHNYIYHIVRNANHSKPEKLYAIERIMGDGNAISYYREHSLRFAKEQFAQHLRTVKQLVPRIRGRLQRSQVQKRIANAVNSVNGEGISFISQNCIGGVLYHDMGLQFLSPTINAFIPEPGFVKFVLNLRHYMEQELVMRWGEEYPIGMLDDVEIHFMHYETCKEAKESWERRKARINWDRLFVIATDRNGFDDAVFEDWKKITYPKILFTVQKKYASEADSVYFSEYEDNGFVPDLVPSREFYKDGILVNKVNHVGGHL